VKIVKVICIMVIGPILGIGVASLVAGFLLSPDPSGRGAPGDGFMIFYCLGVGLVVSIIISLLLSVWTWRRSPKPDILK
jgi:hypothetical protein